MLALVFTPAQAQQQSVIAFFGEMQERGPSTPEELAQRAQGRRADDPVVAADLALNDWKACVLDAVVARWAELGPSPGTLVDGAYGRCGDQARSYRGQLARLTQGERVVVDLQFARSMVRALEEAWRPRLIAAALDAELARRQQKAIAVPPVKTVRN